MRSTRFKNRTRHGLAAVEAALLLPLLLTLMFGVWEAGRLVQYSQILVNAAREGGRVASGGKVNGTNVTVAMVQQAVRDYMTAAGVPSAAVSGATITLTNTSANSWTDPSDALPGDPFTITATIPPGAAFNSLKFILLNTVTGVSQLSVVVGWTSANDTLITVDTSIPL